MANKISNSIKDFKMEVNDAFVAVAEKSKCSFIHKTVEPVCSVNFEKKDNDWKASLQCSAEQAYKNVLGEKQAVCFDFGTHNVGYISIHLNYAGSPPDAPAFIKIKFGEIPCEIVEKSEEYHGTIGAGWIQEEFIHVDEIPCVLELDRRYAFRYMEITVLALSPKYELVIEKVQCDTVTTADYEKLEPLKNFSDQIKKLDDVSAKTMAECMQDVFEDGPKRDRRLWIGDLRLQALTNYETFKNNQLVKRCLYLFGGLKQNGGRVGACLFTKPKLQVDDTALFDYSLFFVSCLKDYYEHTDDIATLNDLWDTAFHQIELAAERLDEHGLVEDSDDWWCFLDWAEGLNKQAGAQAVFIYTSKQALELAKSINDHVRINYLEKLIQVLTNAAKELLWDEELYLFTSGKEKQVSWASQVWMILAGVFSEKRNQRIIETLEEKQDAIPMVTPYMYHHYVEALIQTGLREKAINVLNEYWGQMIDDGADCYYELYDPKDKYASPYGSRIINSYCHAWSGTPAYFIRKYKLV